MASRTIRTILALDGEAQFQNKIKQINSNLSVMKANMKALTQETDLNGKSVKNTTDKISQYKEQQTQLAQKIDVLKAAVKDSNVQYQNAITKHNDMIRLHGKESEEATKAAKAVTRCEQTYNNYRTQLINTEAELQRVNHETKQLESSMETFGSKLKNVASNIGSLGLTGLKGTVSAVKLEVDGLVKSFELYVKGLTAATGAVVAYSTKVGSSFESNMSSVRATLGYEVDQMEKLEEKAIDLGAKTVFSAAEVADGMKMLAQSGLNEESILRNMTGMIDLAAAAETDLTEVTRMVASAVNTFGDDMHDASYFADILAKASSDSNTNILEMGEAFQYASTVSSLLGFSFRDTALMIELMANKSTQGTRAGTALRAILQNLTAPTKAAREQLEAFGLSSEDIIEKGLADSIQTLKEKFSELDKAEQSVAAKNIAGRNGSSGLLALLTATDEEVNRLSADLDNAQGAASKMAEVKLDNLKGDFTILKSAAETLGDVIYKNDLSGGLRQIVQDMTDLLSRARAIMSGEDTFDTYGTIINSAGNKARSRINEIFDSLKENLPQIITFFNSALAEGVKTFSATLPRFLSEVVPNVINGFKNALIMVRDKIPSIFDAIKEGMKGNGVVGDIAEIFDVGTDIVMSLVNGIAENSDKLLTAAGDILIGIVDSITNNIDTLIDAAFAIVDGLVKFLSNSEILTKLVNAAIKIITNLTVGLCDHIDELIPAVVQIINTIVDALTNKENVETLAVGAAHMLVALGGAIIELVPQLMIEAPQKIASHIADTIVNFDWIGTGTNIMVSIFAGMTKWVSDFKDKIIGIGSSISGLIFGEGSNAASNDYSSITEATTSLDNFSKASNGLVSSTSGNSTTNNSNINTNFSINVYDAKNDIPTVVESTQQYIDSLRYGKGRY